MRNGKRSCGRRRPSARRRLRPPPEPAGNGTVATTRNRSSPGPTTPASSRPSTADNRSRSPTIPDPVPDPVLPPEPPPPPTPSFSTVSTTRPSLTRTSTPHHPASPCRSTFVVASRTTHPSADCTSPGSPTASPLTSHEIPAAVNTLCAPRSSALRSASRYPRTTSRTSRCDSRAIRCTSIIWSTASGRSRRASCTASSLLRAITARFRPITSCRSRPNRSRSSATASRVRVSRASSSS
ncbi:hypothetical protein T45_08717 [Streptomyces turgidiscabies]|nr:hypothetical protein T45_08717 [Streptomyces turgidiscabies]